MDVLLGEICSQEAIWCGSLKTVLA